MTNTKRFTIEHSSSSPPDQKEVIPIKHEPVSSSEDTSILTIEAIKEAVSRIIKDELENWSHTASSNTPGAPEDTDTDNPTNDILRELSEIQSHIATTKAEIAALKPRDEGTSQFTSAKQELQEIVDSTAKATHDILSESERIVEISTILADRLPEHEIESIGVELAALENSSTNIMLACGFQDLTGQRITKVVNTMIFVEEKINNLMQLWKIDAGTASGSLQSNRPDDERPDLDLLNGPQKEGEGISQDDIDALFS